MGFSSAPRRPAEHIGNGTNLALDENTLPMNDAELEGLTREGRLESSGCFTVDPARAEATLVAKMRLPLTDAILSIVRGMMGLGGESLEVNWRHNTLQIRLRGSRAEPDWEELNESLTLCLVGNRPARYLALGILRLSGGEPRRLRLWGPTGGLVLDRVSAPPPSVEELRFLCEFGASPECGDLDVGRLQSGLELSTIPVLWNKGILPGSAWNYLPGFLEVLVLAEDGEPYILGRPKLPCHEYFGPQFRGWPSTRRGDLGGLRSVGIRVVWSQQADLSVSRVRGKRFRDLPKIRYLMSWDEGNPMGLGFLTVVKWGIPLTTVPFPEVPSGVRVVAPWNEVVTDFEGTAPVGNDDFRGWRNRLAREVFRVLNEVLPELTTSPAQLTKWRPGALKRLQTYGERMLHVCSQTVLSVLGRPPSPLFTQSSYRQGRLHALERACEDAPVQSPRSSLGGKQGLVPLSFFSLSGTGGKGDQHVRLSARVEHVDFFSRLLAALVSLDGHELLLCEQNGRMILCLVSPKGSFDLENASPNAPTALLLYALQHPPGEIYACNLSCFDEVGRVVRSTNLLQRNLTPEKRLCSEDRSCLQLEWEYSSVDCPIEDVLCIPTPWKQVGGVDPHYRVEFPVGMAFLFPSNGGGTVYFPLAQRHGRTFQEEGNTFVESADLSTSFFRAVIVLSTGSEAASSPAWVKLLWGGVKVADFALGNLNFHSRVSILWPCADYREIYRGLDADQMGEVLELLERVISFDEELDKGGIMNTGAPGPAAQVRPGAAETGRRAS